MVAEVVWRVKKVTAVLLQKGTEEAMDSRTEVQRYLEGVEYPANRHRLGGATQANGAPVDFIKTLLGLGSTPFSGPEDVIEELERLRDPTQNRPLSE